MNCLSGAGACQGKKEEHLRKELGNEPVKNYKSRRVRKMQKNSLFWLGQKFGHLKKKGFLKRKKQ